MHKHAQTYTSRNRLLRVRARAHTHTHTHTHTQALIQKHTHKRTQTQKEAWTHAYMQTHTHTPSFKRIKPWTFTLNTNCNSLHKNVHLPSHYTHANNIKYWYKKGILADTQRTPFSAWFWGRTRRGPDLFIWPTGWRSQSTYTTVVEFTMVLDLPHIMFNFGVHVWSCFHAVWYSFHVWSSFYAWFCFHVWSRLHDMLSSYHIWSSFQEIWSIFYEF